MTDESDAPSPLASGSDHVFETGSSPTWILGTVVAAAAIAFIVAVAFEVFIRDIEVVGPWWGLDMLVAGVAGWLALMVAVAVRLRADDDGLHLRTLRRNRSWDWSELESVGLVPSRSPVVDSVVAIGRSGGEIINTPLALNTYSSGPEGLLQAIAPVAGRHGLPIAPPDVGPVGPAPSLDI